MFFGKEIVEEFTPGYNELIFTLPSNILNKGVYYINLALHRNYSEIIDAHKEAFFFEIEENPFRYNKYPKINTGVLNIKL
jgi:hypothetical protein